MKIIPQQNHMVSLIFVDYLERSCDDVRIHYLIHSPYFTSVYVNFAKNQKRLPINFISKKEEKIFRRQLASSTTLHYFFQKLRRSVTSSPLAYEFDVVTYSRMLVYEKKLPKSSSRTFVHVNLLHSFQIFTTNDSFYTAFTLISSSENESSVHFVFFNEKKKYEENKEMKE